MPLKTVGLWIKQNLKNGLLRAEHSFTGKKLNSETLNTIPECDFPLVIDTL